MRVKNNSSNKQQNKKSVNKGRNNHLNPRASYVKEDQPRPAFQQKIYADAVRNNDAPNGTHKNDVNQEKRFTIRATAIRNFLCSADRNQCVQNEGSTTRCHRKTTDSMSVDSRTKIISWNARSLRSDPEQMYLHQLQQHSSPHIICLQGTKIKIPGYTWHQLDRPGGNGSGVAIGSKYGYKHRPKMTPRLKSIEATSVDVEIGDR